MDNEWQNYLNQLLLYSMDNDSPNYGAWYTNGVIFNVMDWSQAPLDFVPFNPSPTNYQVPGDSPGWNVRSVKLQDVTQTLMNQIFAAAAAGTDQVASLWAHLAESDFLPSLVQIDELAHVAATNYPTVPFLYCTAVEAMQRWRGWPSGPRRSCTFPRSVQGEKSRSAAGHRQTHLPAAAVCGGQRPLRAVPNCPVHRVGRQLVDGRTARSAQDAGQIRRRRDGPGREPDDAHCALCAGRPVHRQSGPGLPGAQR